MFVDKRNYTRLRAINNEQVLVLREFSASSNPDLQGELRKTRHV